MIKSKTIPILYEKKENCSGCTACYAICPKEAISMVEDEEGFEYPQIDENKCVRCYQCIKVCPIKAARACRTAAGNRRRTGSSLPVCRLGRYSAGI